MERNSLELAIAIAARDISDAMETPPARRVAVNSLLEMALWSAASVADSVSPSAWVDPGKDDGWIKSAADERYELPSTLTDRQFRELAELLKLGKDSIEKSLPARIRMQPELAKDVARIVGSPVPDAGASKLDAPEIAAPPIKAPEPSRPSKPLEDTVTMPAKREPDIKRDDVRAPADEFDDSIIENPGLPGDPRSKP